MILRTTLVLLCLSCGTASGASFRTQNFLVTASSPEIAAQIADRAEESRRELAISWLGVELPAWREPCCVRAYVRGTGGTGETSFEFDARRPAKLRMVILGPLDRLLDSVIPHEVTHLVLATHFGRRLPPWIDEGASTVVESTSEQEKLRKAVRKILSGERRLSLSQLMTVQEYPRDIVPLYTQGHALSSYLIQHGGRKKLVRFLQDGLAAADRVVTDQTPPSGAVDRWATAIHQHYGFPSLAALESSWMAWIADARFLADERQILLAGGEATQAEFPVGLMADPLGE